MSLANIWIAVFLNLKDFKLYDKLDDREGGWQEGWAANWLSAAWAKNTFTNATWRESKKARENNVVIMPMCKKNKHRM